jgi:predicted CXXCH cytochrome family protein
MPDDSDDVRGHVVKSCLACLIAALPLVLAAAAQIPPARPGVAVLYPPDGCVIAGNAVRVVAVAPAFRKSPGVTLDGRPLKMERAAFAEDWMTKAIRRGNGPPDRPALLDNRQEAALWMAVAPLSPGRHVLSADGRKARLFRSARADGSGGPAGWPLFRPHLPVAESAGSPACGPCHEESRPARNRTLGGVRTPAACHTCHTEADLQLKHNHIMDMLSRCWTCHDPHGSARSKLLVDEKKKLCSRCHEEGHSKK